MQFLSIRLRSCALDESIIVYLSNAQDEYARKLFSETFRLTFYVTWRRDGGGEVEKAQRIFAHHSMINVAMHQNAFTGSGLDKKQLFVRAHTKGKNRTEIDHCHRCDYDSKMACASVSRSGTHTVFESIQTFRRNVLE